MSKAKQVLDLIENESGSKPQTNFDDKPEVLKAIKQVAQNVYSKLQDDISSEMSSNNTLSELEDDDTYMAWHDIEAMLVKLITHEE